MLWQWILHLAIYFNYDHTTAVFPPFRIPCSSRFSSRSSCSFTSCTYSNLLAEATAGGAYPTVSAAGGNPTMMDSDVSEGKLGYLVLKSGIEPSLPPAATFASISTSGSRSGDTNYIRRSWTERYVGLRRTEIRIFPFVLDDRTC